MFHCQWSERKGNACLKDQTFMLCSWKLVQCPFKPFSATSVYIRTTQSVVSRSCLYIYGRQFKNRRAISSVASMSKTCVACMLDFAVTSPAHLILQPTLSSFFNQSCTAELPTPIHPYIPIYISVHNNMIRVSSGPQKTDRWALWYAIWSSKGGEGEGYYGMISGLVSRLANFQY